MVFRTSMAFRDLIGLGDDGAGGGGWRWLALGGVVVVVVGLLIVRPW